MLQTILLYLSNLSALLAVWTGRRERTVIWLYALLSFIFDMNGYVLNALDIERKWASNIFFLVEFVLISTYFIREVFPGYKKALRIIVAVISLYFVVHTCMKSVWVSNYVDAAIMYELYIFFSICGLYKVMQEIKYVMVERNPLFIFCIAFLLYASGSLFIFLVGNDFLQTERDFIIGIWKLVRNPLNIVKNLLIAYGLLLIRRNHLAQGA